MRRAAARSTSSRSRTGTSGRRSASSTSSAPRRMSGARFAVLMGAGARLARALINFMLDAAHARARLHRGRAAVPGQRRRAARHRQPAEVRAGPVQDRRRLGPLPDPDRRGAADEPHRDEILDGRAAAAALHRLHAVLPQRGRLVRRRRARPDPAAPVRQGRAREVHHARAVVRRARVARRRTPKRCCSASACPTARCVLCTGDMGFASAKTYDIEVWLPEPADVSRDLVLQQHAAFQARRANIKFRPQGTGKAELVHTLNGSGLAVGPHADRDPRELPAGGRLGRRPPASAVHGRPRHHRPLTRSSAITSHGPSRAIHDMNVAHHRRRRLSRAAPGRGAARARDAGGPDGQPQAIDRLTLVDVASATADRRSARRRRSPATSPIARCSIGSSTPTRPRCSISPRSSAARRKPTSISGCGSTSTAPGCCSRSVAPAGIGRESSSPAAARCTAASCRDVVPGSTALTPQSSYGSQKAMGELLVNDYTRRGFIDGRALRLPTISVRPGKPNAALSSFASGIIREPLNGVESVCPVPRRHAGVAAVAGDGHRVLHRGARDRRRLARREPQPDPARLDRQRRRDGRRARARRRPGGRGSRPLRARRARRTDRQHLAGRARRLARTRLGFPTDTSFDDIIRRYIADDWPGRGS